MLDYHYMGSDDAVTSDYRGMDYFLLVCPIYLNSVYLFDQGFEDEDPRDRQVVRPGGFPSGGSEGLHVLRSDGRCFVRSQEGPRGYAATS